MHNFPGTHLRVAEVLSYHNHAMSIDRVRQVDGCLFRIPEFLLGAQVVAQIIQRSKECSSSVQESIFSEDDLIMLDELFPINLIQPSDANIIPFRVHQASTKLFVLLLHGL